MVGSAYFMGGGRRGLGGSTSSLALLCSRASNEEATSPARDDTHSKSCVVQGLGVLRGSTSFYLPPGFRFLTSPNAFDRIDHASLFDPVPCESRRPLWTSSSRRPFLTSSRHLQSTTYLLRYR